MKVRGDHVGWLKLNVTRAADLWSLFPASNMGMFMRVTNRKGVCVCVMEGGFAMAYTLFPAVNMGRFVE